jgi:uncharacterized protein YukE
LIGPQRGWNFDHLEDGKERFRIEQEKWAQSISALEERLHMALSDWLKETGNEINFQAICNIASIKIKEEK